tara:strand:- start:3608 stop:4042 length:435 start_codon:yes stop_codon:yes gene_type:complete
MDDPKTLAILMSAMFISLEIIKALVIWITKNFKKEDVKSNNTIQEYCKLTEDEREWLKSLYDWHDKEYDGKKIWYIPKDLEPNQREILNTCLLINTTQNKLLENQSQVIKIFTGIQYEIDNIKDDVTEINRNVNKIQIKQESIK